MSSGIVNCRFLAQCSLGVQSNGDLQTPAVHKAVGAIENITGSLSSSNAIVLFGATDGYIYGGNRGTCSASTGYWEWATKDSGTTNTNFTISAIAGSTGSATNPKMEFLAAAINTSTNNIGYMITSSDGGASWSQYTIPDLGKGIVNKMYHDGRKYIGVGYSASSAGTKGRIIQSRGDCISNPWIATTVCAPLVSSVYGDGVI